MAEDRKKSLTLTADHGADVARRELTEATELALERARAAGATGVAVGASIHEGLSATVRMRQVETIEHSRDRGMGITVYFDHRKGSASTGDLARTTIETAVDKACAIARFTEADPCAGLPDAERLAREPRELDLWHPWALDADGAIDLALAMECAALDADPLIRNSEGASVTTGHSVSVFANSDGFLGHRLSSRHSLSCSVLAEDENDKQRDYEFDVKRAAADLMAAEAVGLGAARRAVARHGAREIGTTRVPVLYQPEVARTLIGHLVSAVSGGNLYRGTSFLIDAAGEALFPEFVTIEERPFEPRGLRSTWFDSEGVATCERRLVDAGRLTGYVLGSYSARRLGRESTGNSGGVHNLTVVPGELDFDALVKRMGRGLVVTELMGQGVNITTGDYSRGASGFWVENGQIAYPVEGVTVAGSLRDLFQRIAAVGSDLDRRAGIRSPSLLIDAMTVGGQ